MESASNTPDTAAPAETPAAGAPPTPPPPHFAPPTRPGVVMAPDPAAQPATGFGKLIPTGNQPALVGYYIGVASLVSIIPIIGLIGVLSGPAAMILGFKGLRRAKQVQAGTAHAIVAMVLGLVGLLLGLGSVAFVIVLVSNRM